MIPAVALDGCSLVILRQRASHFRIRFEVVDRGVLSFDGDTLVLESTQPRVISSEEQRRILVVSDANRIPECAGFRLFILQDAGT